MTMKVCSKTRRIGAQRLLNQSPQNNFAKCRAICSSWQAHKMKCRQLTIPSKSNAVWGAPYKQLNVNKGGKMPLVSNRTRGCHPMSRSSSWLGLLLSACSWQCSRIIWRWSTERILSIQAWTRLAASWRLMKAKKWWMKLNWLGSTTTRKSTANESKSQMRQFVCINTYLFDDSF